MYEHLDLFLLFYDDPFLFSMIFFMGVWLTWVMLGIVDKPGTWKDNNHE